MVLHLREGMGLPGRRSIGHNTRHEPGHGPGQCKVPGRFREACHIRCGAFLRRLQIQSEIRDQRSESGRDGRCRMARPVRYERGFSPFRDRCRGRGGSALRRSASWVYTPTTIPTWQRPTAYPQWTADARWYNAQSTAWERDAGTPTCAPSSRT